MRYHYVIFNSKGVAMSAQVEIRCPSCRGSKKVYLLGGIQGDCLNCKGSGKILASEKPVLVTYVPECTVVDIIQAVEEIQAVKPTPVTESDIVIKSGSRALYRRKSASKAS
jgi:hypothetical protein